MGGLIKVNSVNFMCTCYFNSAAGDGRLGFADGGPYDCIHVGAAAPKIPPAVILTIIIIIELFYLIANFVNFGCS